MSKRGNNITLKLVPKYPDKNIIKSLRYIILSGSDDSEGILFISNYDIDTKK